MIRIGVVNIDTSHPKTFAGYLLNCGRARYVAVYNDGFRGDDEVEGFIKNCQLEKRCGSIEELAEFVDIGFIQSCNWEKHIEQAMPFIKRGKPVFIDKPIAGSPAHCKKLEELVSKDAMILGSSSIRYAKEISDFLSIPEEERGKVLNIFGTTGVDEFNYGIHIAEAIGAIAGTGAISNRFVGRSSISGKKCDTFYTVYSNGITAVYNVFQGVWQPFVIVVMTTKGTYQFEIDSLKAYEALLNGICDSVEAKANRLASIEAITESVRIMIAGRISRENGGAEVYIKDIPEDDRGFDGYLFERGYAAASKDKIYLEA